MTFTVVYDANVLYPNTLRDLLIRIAQSGRDFPAADLEPWNIEAKSPDAFVLDQVHINLQAVAASIRQIADSRTNPPEAVEEPARVFAEVVDLYLKRIHFAADGYAQLIRLPQYRLANVTVDPDHGFGRPRFAGGAAVDDVIDLFRAGEPVDVVADEFGLSRDEVEDAIRVAARPAA